MVTSPNRTGLSRILATSLMAVSLAACASVQAQDADTTPSSGPSPGPAMWEVSDEDTTVHLFGFAPVLATGTEWPIDHVLYHMRPANLVVVESDNSSPEAQAEVQGLIPQIGLNTDGTTLSSRLTEAQRAELDQVTTYLGVPLSALDPLRPWLASVQVGVLTVSRGDFDLANPPSAQVTQSARDAGIEVRALEGPTDLMQIMASFPEETQIGMLLHTARSFRDQPDQQAMLADAWLAGDVQRVGELLHGNDGAWPSDEVYNAMLVQRNQAWLQEIKTLLDEHEGTVIFAVGLGHLAGEDSLVNMLEAEGLAVVRH